MNLKIEILRQLETRERLTPEPALMEEVRITTGQTVTAADFSAALRELERNHHVTGVHPELGGPVKWKITDKGRAAFNTAI